MSRHTRTQAVRDHATKLWLGLAGLLIAAGINVAVQEGWAVALLLAAIAVGGMCAPLLTWGTAAKALTRSEPRAIAELHNEIRKELPR